RWRRGSHRPRARESPNSRAGWGAPGSRRVLSARAGARGTRRSSATRRAADKTWPRRRGPPSRGWRPRRARTRGTRRGARDARSSRGRCVAARRSRDHSAELRGGEPEHAARDDEELDLLRPLEDVEDLRVARPLLEEVVLLV